MLYITQIIYIQSGQEETFHEFERLAIPIISKYNGALMLRIRPNEDTIIENSIEKPYEIHIVSFETAQDFENFKLDEERRKFLHLKDQSIKTALMIQGTKL